MTPSEIIFHRRVRVLEHAAKTSVAEAHRVFGVSRKTIHHWTSVRQLWARRVDAQEPPVPSDAQRDADLGRRGAPRGGGAATHAGRGPLRRVPRGPRLCHLGQWRPEALEPFRVGATTSTRRALARLTAATTGLVTEPALEGPFGFCHFAARPGDLVALDSFSIGKLKGVGPVWQLTAVDTATRWAICAVFIGPSTATTAAGFVDRVIRKLKRLGVTVTGVLSDNGPEFTGTDFIRHVAGLGLAHHRTPPRSPNHNAVCERFQGTALQECWRPALPPAPLRSTHPTARRDRLLARHLQNPPTQPVRLHARTNTPPSPRHPPSQASSMTAIHTVHLSPQPVARKT